MHTSFTGSAKRSRQVNLSGRNASNPWAALSGGTKPSQTTGTQSTIANAQADRVRRQQERDRQNAARKIQRTWRGHSVRQVQKQKWRLQWDHTEQERLHITSTINYHKFVAGDLECVPYAEPQELLTQMRLLTRFVRATDFRDVLRVLFLVEMLRRMISVRERRNVEEEWHLPLLKITRFMLKACELSTKLQTTDEEKVWLSNHILDQANFLIQLIPDDIDDDASRIFHALTILVQDLGYREELLARISDLARTVLSRGIFQVYGAFASEMLCSVEATRMESLLQWFDQSSHLISLCKAVSTLISSEQQLNSERLLWMLSYLLHLSKKGLEDPACFEVWINALSALLSYCANDISSRVDEMDTQMDEGEDTTRMPLHPFVREKISQLAQQKSVESIVQQLKRSGSESMGSASVLAKPLANYAVALLRAFPHQASSIRMWLYRSSPPSIIGSMSTIQYLWQATRATSVFQKIIKDHRSVLSVLTEAAPEQTQIGRAPVSAADVAVWQEEWRIILLFMELYTFILKIMDDEEFFALDDDRGFSVKQLPSQFAQGALPLPDVARLTTFLKNLAFPLYWNAADLAETNEVEETGGISALFGTTPTEPARQTEKKQPKTLAGNGVSQAYLKDRVTALLRMLHERDSRRRFLPESHWLMTNQVDMQGFIPAVVAEEERRHAAGDLDSDDEDADANEDDALETDDTFALQNFNSLFGIRPPHTSRTQTSRFSDQMVKRRARERKRRQAESLVPRIEILRNLPFFIPFDTRVQIFREFVYRDQFTRRNGWVDPDQWRFSVANGTQGRSLDGRPRGIDLISRHHAEIRRGEVFNDAYDKFYEIGEALKEPIQISFIDQFDTPEAGIDGGGVTKEFLMSVTGEAFDTNQKMPMFVENEQRFLFPNSKVIEYSQETLSKAGINGEETSFHIREILRRYEFLGRIVGKCMYEGILVDLTFAGFFLLKWALTGGTTSATNETAYRASINDLKDYDEELYRGLLKLKNYKGDVETDFGLDFTASDEVELENGQRHTWTKELIPNGSNTPVTNTNRLLYIDRITRYRLQQQPQQVTNAFLKGLGQIIQPMWLAMFNQRELQKLVGGDNAELDISDLRRNTQYGGLYVIGDDGIEHPTVALFWKVLKEMTDGDRRKVLKFVTSTPRAPLLGFSHLNPKFSIRDSSEDQTRLPSTSTCVNLLKLPRYGDERTMREKLLYAVNSGAGFDLS